LLISSIPAKLIWGLGPTFLLPTATGPTLGQGKWGAGPSVVLLVQPQYWTIGDLCNNIWFFAGNRGRPRVNQFLTQYFVTRNFEHGWFLTSSSILTANWRAPADNQWLITFGGGFGKITKFFDQPMVWQMRVITTPPIHRTYHTPSGGPTSGGSALPDSEMNGVACRG
jgi:hypothetical protein